MSRFDPAVAALVAAVIAALAAIVTAVLSRRSSQEANKVDQFQAITDALEKRIEVLERELGTVKTALVDEQTRHGETRELLRVAMKHIRDMLSWLGGNRAAEPPTVPDALTHQL